MPAPAYVRQAVHSESGERLRQMAAASGRDIVFNTEWTPNSRRALEAAEYAREQGKHDAFHDAVFDRFYGQGMDMSDWDVLRDAAKEAGLDPDAMQEAVAAGRYASVVDDHIHRAHQLGISGVPAYVLGDRYLIMGAQPYELFQQVMSELGVAPRPDTDEQ